MQWGRDGLCGVPGSSLGPQEPFLLHALQSSVLNPLGGCVNIELSLLLGCHCR